ncbi:uncharacterized protein LOC122636186 [Vespula pensylvanica]|uniref:uncharacterized protein LOC122636186 n=1 Tax=Vespula pensylvanica TaxID=30213 RepID=UPI001CBA15EC|nr:uncharacterized protein LOC122636186 [Vespula pensylvanica]
MIIYQRPADRDDKWIDLVRQSNGEDDKTSLTTVTSTIQDSILSTQSQSIRSIYDKSRDFEGHVLQRSGGGRVFSYRKKKPSIGNGIFSAPAGVNPHHVASSIVRRNTVRTRGKLLTIFAPLLHGILIGLLCMDAIHLWPGEFLPTSLPTTTPIPLPPVKCNVIEPSWFDPA